MACPKTGDTLYIDTQSPAGPRHTTDLFEAVIRVVDWVIYFNVG